LQYSQKGVECVLLEEKKNKSPLVVHSNDLSFKAGNDFGANMLRVFFYVLSQIPYDANEIPSITIEVSSLLGILGREANDTGWRHQIKETLDDLATRLVYLYDMSDKQSMYRLTWFDYIKEDGNGKTYEFKLKNELEPYLLRLNKDFTRYRFSYLLEFNKSVYSIKLYDYLHSVAYKGTISMSLEMFRQQMSLIRINEDGEIISDAYSRYEDLSKKVLKPALKEINEKSDITATYAPVKDSADRRKTSGIKFTISIKENPPTYDYVIPPARLSEYKKIGDTTSE